MKKRNKLTVGMILLTVAIIIASIIFLFILVMPGVKSSVKRLGKNQLKTEKSDDEPKFPEEARPDFSVPEDENSWADDEFPWDDYFGDEELWDDYFQDGYGGEPYVLPQIGVPQEQDILQSDVEVPYDLSISNDYLTEFVENINPEVSYDLNWSFDHYASEAGDVTWTASYYELSGDIPNIEVLNSQIYERCTYVEQLYLYYLENDADAYYYTYDGKGTSQVTYNDENFISILIQNEYTLNGSKVVALDAINIDIVEGRILEDYEIFLPDRGIANRFVDQNLLQNGDSELLSMMKEEEILSYLTSSSTSVIFFSDKGMEIGFSYIYSYFDEEGTEMAATGYVTITLNDYENYLVKTE